MVSALPMDQLRHLWRPGRFVGRAFTWAVAYRSGRIATEDAYGSLALVPRIEGDPIVTLAVVPASDPTDRSRHYRMQVPEGAEPVIFWRTARNVDHGTASALTVLGWRWPNGAGSYLYVHDDGRVVASSSADYYGD